MAKTNWQDPKTSEMRSTHVSGLMEAVGKIEDSIGMESVFETNVPLTEVFISSDDRYRIFQAPEGKRNWTAEQAPVIKRNGVTISSGFEIDYGGGAIILNANDTVENTYTANVTYIKTSKVRKLVRFVIGTSTSGWTEKDCDYLCDGTADQTEINAAITALPATGGEIVILDGTYNITAKINVTKDNVSIRGNGNATILKRMFNSSVAEGVITLNSRSGCKIANLQIDGNMTSHSNSNNYGIYLSSSSNNTVTGNTCYNNNRGIELYSSSNNTVTGNTCNDNSRGIELYSSSNNNTVTGNTCYNNSSGIYLSSSSNNTITGNACIRGTGQTSDYTSDQYTIRLQGTANSYNLIASNNCMGKAPVVEGGTGNTVINNKWDATSDFEDLRTDVGDKTTLITTDKTNLVNAVNETKAQINDLEADYEKEATEFSIASDETYYYSTTTKYYKKNGWVKLTYRISRVDEGLIQRSEYLLRLPVGFRPKTSFVTVAVQCDVGITPPLDKMTLRIHNTGQLQAQENATKKIIHGEAVFYAGGGTV